MFLRKQAQPGDQMSPLQDIGWMLDRFMPNFAAFPRMPGIDVFVDYPTINVNDTDGVVWVQAEVPGSTCRAASTQNGPRRGWKRAC